METSQASPPAATLAKPLAPEDVCPGDYIALLEETIELPSFLWCCDDNLLGDNWVVRLRYHPRSAGTPLLVKQVCLPFVFVRAPCGKRRTLDLRACRVARLDKGYAKGVCRALKSHDGSGGRAGKKRKKK